jgi:hypothetical protein
VGGLRAAKATEEEALSKYTKRKKKKLERKAMPSRTLLCFDHILRGVRAWARMRKGNNFHCPYPRVSRTVAQKQFHHTIEKV